MLNKEYYKTQQKFLNTKLVKPEKQRKIVKIVLIKQEQFFKKRKY